MRSAAIKKILAKFRAPDSMEFEALQERTTQLLAGQRVRNPLRNEMLACIEEYELFKNKAPSFATQCLLMQAHLHDMIASPAFALQALVQVFEDGSPREHRQAAEQALDIVRNLGTKKYARQLEDEQGRALTAKCLTTIVDATKSTELGTRIDVYVTLYKRDARGALAKAHEAVKSYERPTVDLIYVVSNILFRSDSNDFLPEIARIVNDVEPILRKAGKVAFLTGIRVRNAGALAGPGLLKPLELSEIQDILADAKPVEIQSLLLDKSLFLFRYNDCEPIKLAILQAYRNLLDEKAPTAASLKKLLERSTQTHEFWASAEYRAELIGYISSKIADDTTPEGSMVLGSIALLDKDPVKAHHYFDRSITAGTQFDATGATSFFVDLTGNDEKDFTKVEIDFESVTRSDLAYVCCADLGYFKRYAREYATSLRATGSQERIHFHIAAPSHDAAAQAVRHEVSDIANISFSSEIAKLLVPTYFASMRFLRGPDFLTYVASRVVLTDIDVVFRQNPDSFARSPLWDGIDVGFRLYDQVRVVRQGTSPHAEMMRYPRLLPWSQVNAACVALFDSDNGRDAARRISQDMHRHLGRALSRRKAAWWIDQNSLLMTFLSLKAQGRAKIGNVEDVGLPYGSFSYEGSYTLTGGHPLLRE